MQSKPQPNQYVYFKTALPLKKTPPRSFEQVAYVAQTYISKWQCLVFTEHSNYNGSK